MTITFPKRTKNTPKKMRYTGFEIECITKKGWDPDNNWDEEYDKKVLGKAKKFVLDIHDDGSVEGSGYPAEVVTYPLLEKRKRAIKQLCNEIKNRGGYVNNTCGGHIHIDAKDVHELVRNNNKNSELAVKFLTLFEPALFAITGKSRLSNSFCKPMHLYNNNDVQNVYREFSYDRYWSVNLGSLSKYGTIEFRLFAGTLDDTKWSARAAFAEAIINKLHACLKKPELLDKLHKKSFLADFSLDDINKRNYGKIELYRKIIEEFGPKLVEESAKMAGLHKNYRNMLVKQHNDIWSKYAKKLSE